VISIGDAIVRCFAVLLLVPSVGSVAGHSAAQTPAVTRTLYTFPEADFSVTPLYALVNNAQNTIDMTMY